MAKNNIIDLHCFGQEIGKIGFDENRSKSSFQYNPDYLKSGIYSNLFPFILKKVAPVQVFGQFNNETFRGLPPAIADSLPDVFGNLIFKTWLESKQKDFKKISIIEQLAYVANRGMGALEYLPGKKIPIDATINIDEIVNVLKLVLENKQDTSSDRLDSTSLLNIFKIGSSAGGARPKILISENKKTHKIIPGDLEYSEEYNHLLVKLCVDQEHGYQREVIEYAYYLTAMELGITMMPSHLIEDKHFATLRYDRQDGKKQHVLTASGMTGWDFKNPDLSSYENLFKLASSLKLPHKQLDELFNRMIFNLVFANTDDHLKNHSFIYDPENDRWNLSPAYDLTYAFNPLLKVTKSSRALSINNKRTDIKLKDLLSLADEYTIKNPKGIIEKMQNGIELWLQNAKQLQLSEKIISNIYQDFITFQM
ncbi:type II toxin-antitoxin system HipA family toxin [Pedobacter sp. KBW06]|uniref:type II toxin-antitoxin system HipA family toxin n=1 Tax=Pedobacter sp. KBW06 TaxID=2153359 RepID=UPI000F590103|nr:type II toxin-antitoxin system HipA family toxin [Pedobacter sp. KBW06]RQO75576.1 type II toxin-antitoxin system HipA family toxin [Pedobacter sp. KBW06]